MKKITSVLLAVVMMLSVMNMTAFAVGASECIQLTADANLTGKKLSVKLTAAQDTTNGRITVAYDSRMLVYSDISASDLVIGVNVENGQVTVAYAVKDDAVQAGEEILSIVFTTRNSGTTTLQAVLEEFNENESLDAECEDLIASITILPNVVPGTQPGTQPDAGDDAGNDTEEGETEEDAEDETEEDSEDETEEEPSVEMENFGDVSENQWFYEAVEHVVESGYFKGVTENSFAPQDKMTRAMFVTVLGRIANVEETSEGISDFSDVKSGQWFSGFVAWASEAGIVQGANGKFDPNGNITREQMAVFLYRYAQYAGLDLTIDSDAVSKYSDFKNVSSWAQDAMAWAVSNGIINGTGVGLEPQATATRAQVAQIVLNFDSVAR